MQKDGLIPFAFADKDLWPALGTFDILNLRVNGYDYHISLMHNQASLDRPAGHRGVQPVARADALPAERRDRPHLAGRLQDAGEPSRRA